MPQYSPSDTRPRPRGAGSPYPSGDGWPYTSDNDYDWLAADVARFVGEPYSNGGGGSYPSSGGWAYPTTNGGWAYPSDGGSNPTRPGAAYSPPSSGPYPVGGGRPRPRHRKPPSQRMRRSGALLALTLAGGIAAIGIVDAGGGHPAITGADELNGKSAVLMPPRPASVALAASALPEPVGQPVQAYMPRHSAENGKSGTPKKRATAAPSHSASPSPTASAPASASPTHSAAPSPTSSPTQPTTGGGGGGSCTNPSFTTSDTFGSENLGAYTVANNMWNVGGGGISQALSACSSSSWFVKATVADDGGGVKTYPNSHLSFDNTPKISSLNSVTSTFAQNTPDSGNYEDAYDIWLNGTAGAGGDEIMIWTENHGQIPAGSPTTSVTFDGAFYTVWKGGSGPVSFVANSNVTSGNLNLLQFFQWLMNKGWERTDSTLNQVDYGAELVSTNGQETFNFSDFSVSSR